MLLPYLAQKTGVRLARFSTVILRRYVIREVFQAFLLVLVALMLIYVSRVFVGYIRDAAAGTLSSGLIFELLALKLLGKLDFLLPLAVYVAVLFGLGRLYKDSEVVAMIAGGVGLPSLARAVLWIAVTMGVVSMVLSLFITPKLASMEADILARAREESQITGIYPGRFNQFKDGALTVYTESIAPDGNGMHNVFIVYRKDVKEHVYVADYAYQQLMGTGGRRRYIVLERGHRYTGRPGQLNYQITTFEKHAVLLDVGRARPSFRKQGVFTTIELLDSNKRRDKAELHRRVSLPISTIILALLAVPLARTSPRQGKYARLFPAFLIYFAYNNCIGVFEKFVERGEVHPMIGVWPVHVVMIVIVFTLFSLQTASPGYLGRLISKRSAA